MANIKNFTNGLLLLESKPDIQMTVVHDVTTGLHAIQLSSKHVTDLEEQTLEKLGFVMIKPLFGAPVWLWHL